MLNVSRNPYLRKTVENRENTAITSSVVSDPVATRQLALDDSDSNSSIKDSFQDHLQNNRKRPFPTPLVGNRLDPPPSPHIPSPSRVNRLGENTTNISPLNPYMKKDQYAASNLEEQPHPSSIQMESKSLNDLPCNNTSPTVQAKVDNHVDLTSLDANVHVPIMGDCNNNTHGHSTNQNNLQQDFDEYDFNIDWNAAVQQIDLDQISYKTTGLESNNVSFKPTLASTDQYVHPSNNASADTKGVCNIQSSAPYSIFNNLSVCNELKLLTYDKARVSPVDDEYKPQLIKNADLNGVFPNGWTLLSHQKAGVLRALMMRRLVLAFDMGLGKTLVGCVWAKAFKATFPDIQIFIICPVSLAEEWGRTAWETTRLECEFDDKRIGTKTSKAKSAGNSCRGPAICKIFSWAKVPPVPNNIQKYIIICDEAHQMQNTETSRTKETLNLALSERCIGVLLLTGTPMKNGKPSNIFPLLKAVRHPFGDDQRAFEVTFCNGHFRHFKMNKVWDASGASNLPTLNTHIASHVLCKTKEDCLQDLPPKTREYKTIQVSSRFELQYVNAMNELAKVQDMVDNSTEDDIQSEAVLGAFQIVRLIASKAKIDATVSMARSILETESSIVIFTYFVDVAKEVQKKLRDIGWNGEVLAGDVPPTKRQAMVDKFQSGVTPVFIATFGAGGVGLTLTAACTIILLDRPWTPGDAFQAEDRVRRIGQTRPVRSIWMRGFDVDLHIDNMIEQKNQNATTVVDGRSARAEGCATAVAPKVSLRSLIQDIIVKNSSAVRELQSIYNPS